MVVIDGFWGLSGRTTLKTLTIVLNWKYRRYLFSDVGCRTNSGITNSDFFDFILGCSLSITKLSCVRCKFPGKMLCFHSFIPVDGTFGAWT